MKLKYKILNLFYSQKTKSKHHRILSKYNTYYRGLDRDLKNAFVLRNIYFTNSTTFSTDPKLGLQNPIEILISSAFVQITFGLNQDCLNIFNNIFVMAAPYSYKQSKDVYKGDVNANTGSINLAWPSVKEGFYIDDDALNLAIHEFSHGILLEHINTTSNSPFFDKRRLKEYNVFAQQKLEKVRAGNNVVFRDYAGTNIMELFAVALETFFEKPSDFATHEPDLYKSICYLLNQNPIKEGSPLIYA